LLFLREWFDVNGFSKGTGDREQGIGKKGWQERL
jgi:hypothetical protein